MDGHLCSSSSSSTAPARGGGVAGGADGLGTPAGHSPSPRRDLQAETPVCSAGSDTGNETAEQ